MGRTSLLCDVDLPAPGVFLLVLLVVISAHPPFNAIASEPGYAKASVEHKFERYLTRMQPLLNRYGYAIVAGAVLAEGVGIPLPGQTLVIAGALEVPVARQLQSEQKTGAKLPPLPAGLSAGSTARAVVVRKVNRTGCIVMVSALKRR